MNTKDIILLGRSIGGGIAFSIAAKYPAASVVLLSPFLSLKKIASDLYGSCSSAVLKETFDNEHNAKNIASPILLIHGLKDQLVPYEHSVAILGECRSYCRLHLVENMTHSKFSFRRDFTWPLKNFLHDLDIVTWLFIIWNHWALRIDYSTDSSSITYVANFFSLFLRMKLFLFLFRDSFNF